MKYFFMRGTVVVLFASLLGACCATPPLQKSLPPKPLTKVTLLPQSDGSNSSVIVKTLSEERVINAPYQRLTVQEDQPSRTDTTNAEDIQKAFPQLYASLPPRPTKYILNFMPGGTALTADSIAQLPKILEDATNRSGADLVVTGHTDTKGALTANDELSLKRAKAVAQLLVDKGAVATRVESVGRGKRELLVPTADEVNEPKNRRVEIIVR